MNTQARNIDATSALKKNLTTVASMYYGRGMVRYSDIEKRVEQQYNADAKSLKKNYARQNELLSAVMEFNDLEREARLREDRMRRSIELLGDDNFEDTRKAMLAGDDVSRDIVTTLNDESPLWESMRTILEQVPELQVVDLQDALLHFEKKPTRQAIESALGAHKEIFRTVVRNRDKFVSLKR